VVWGRHGRAVAQIRGGWRVKVTGVLTDGAELTGNANLGGTGHGGAEGG